MVCTREDRFDEWLKKTGEMVTYQCMNITDYVVCAFASICALLGIVELAEGKAATSTKRLCSVQRAVPLSAGEPHC